MMVRGTDNPCAPALITKATVVFFIRSLRTSPRMQTSNAQVSIGVVITGGSSGSGRTVALLNIAVSK